MKFVRSEISSMIAYSVKIKAEACDVVDVTE